MSRRIGGYDIEGTLGEGGMGVVYRGKDPTLGRAVAIKVIRTEALGSQGRERFLREARACAAITHPNIVTVYAAGEDEGRPFMAMELLEGRTLRQILDQGPVGWEQALRWVAALLDALDRLHKEGIIHRDLKPDNIIVTTDGVIKLMDFGISRVATSQTITVEGTTVGTAHFMSPEQAAGKKVGHESDIFSMGSVLYQMLTGVLPFAGEHPMAILYSITNADPRPLEEQSKDFPEGLGSVIRRALEKDPANRYPTAGDFRDALTAILEGAAGRTAPAERMPFGAFVLKRVIPVAAALAIVGVVVVPFIQNRLHAGDRALAVHHNELGQDFEERGELEHAAAEYRKAIIADRRYALPWNNLATLEMGRQNYAEAESLFRAAIEIDPKYGAALVNLAEVRWNRGDREGAEGLYWRAIEARPDLAGAYNNLGVLLLELSREDEAARVLDRGIALNPKASDLASLLKNRGKASAALGRADEALQHWTRALELSPELAEVHVLLDELFERGGRIEEARAHWRRAVESTNAEEKRKATEALRRLGG